MSPSTHVSETADLSAFLPEVQLEVRQGKSRPATYSLKDVDFLIGSLPGCDLRVAGMDNTGVICLLARHPTGVSVRKLAPAQAILVNGRSAVHAELSDGDQVQIGLLDLRLSIQPAARTPPQLPAELEQSRVEMQERIGQFRQQLLQFQQEKAAALEERAKRESDLAESEKALAQEKAALEEKSNQYQADVLRLDRWQGTLEERDREMQRLTEEHARDREELRLESAELEAQLLQIDEWRAKLTDEAERLSAEKLEHAAVNRDLAERTATLDNQQATMAVLRSRMERMRTEIRAQAHQLDEERARQEARESDLAKKAQDNQRLQLDHDSQRSQYEQDRRQWIERSAVMDTAVRQLKEAQESVAVEDQRLRLLAEELSQRESQLQESDGMLQGRLTQIAEAQERLDLERNALTERSVNLIQREQACETFQEQLRRRGEEIALRHKEMTDQLQGHQETIAALEDQRRELQEEALTTTTHMDARQQELHIRAAEVDKKHAELINFEDRYQDQLNRIAGDRKALAEEHADFNREQEAKLEELARVRAEFEAMRQEANDISRHLPDAELRAGIALDRLGHARGQMREHVTEIHQYVRQCQDELEEVRGRLQADLDKLQQQEQGLRREQDEHRLATVAFRQELIDWQGQIAELKRLLSRDETRLERKQAQAEERARAIEAESERLARHAEDLDQQEREVADRRQEVDRHLVDMRQWYRGKLRELAGMPLTPGELAGAAPAPAAEPGGAETVSTLVDGEPVLVPTGRNILSITGPVEPGDQKLGQVLREAQLIDADTLNALLAEARRQRRSLRQVLLASGVVTLYQLALIEAGNTRGLMLGPVRVIDRLRNSAHETVYRVFDPRRGAEAVLRLLAEADMTDATRPDEFRQRFGQAMLNDPHLGNTLEVFDVAGRPAALQEWLVGLPATDWPPLTAAPGVCHRLLTQAAQGLAAAHRAGVVHGRLHDAQLLLTEAGTLKILGLGEPPWLIGPSTDEEKTARDDLRTLGKIVSGWCTPTGVRKGAKTKPLPSALISVLYRLAADGDAGYRDAPELLQDLAKAAAEIPPNAEAWDRLLKYVREHGATEAILRRSA